MEGAHSSSLKILSSIYLSDNYHFISTRGFSARHNNKKINDINFLQEVNTVLENAQLAIYNLIETKKNPVMVEPKKEIKIFTTKRFSKT